MPSVLPSRFNKRNNTAVRRFGFRRPSASTDKPGGPTVGDTYYEIDTNIMYTWDGSSWVHGVGFGAWVSYTPTWTQGATISKTVNYSRYTRIGRTVFFGAFMAATSSGTVNNRINVTMPITPAFSNELMVGTFDFNDASIPFDFCGAVSLDTPTVLSFQTGSGSSLRLGQPGSGFTGPIVSGDVIYFSVVYEAAA